MAYSLLVWNVQHYRHATPARTRRVAEIIADFDPDVFGLLEFEAKNAVRDLVMNNFTDYDFAMTDSKKAIEILVGWRRGLFEQVIFTQRRKFQSGNVNLRPGGLLSFRQAGEQVFENVLFLHTDSGKAVTDYENRQDMFGKMFRLKSALEGLPEQQGQSRLIALGDLNTMGRSRTDVLPTLRAATEIAELEADALAAGMRMLTKSHDLTYRSAGGSLRGDLDHVIADDGLSFQTFSFVGSQDLFEVECDGWVNLPEPARTTFIADIADHAALYCEIL